MQVLRNRLYVVRISSVSHSRLYVMQYACITNRNMLCDKHILCVDYRKDI